MYLWLANIIKKHGYKTSYVLVYNLLSLLSYSLFPYPLFRSISNLQTSRYCDAWILDILCAKNPKLRIFFFKKVNTILEIAAKKSVFVLILLWKHSTWICCILCRETYLMVAVNFGFHIYRGATPPAPQISRWI